jgi:hypothetical protein
MTKTGEVEPHLSGEKTVKIPILILEEHKLLFMNSIRNFEGKANCYVTWLNGSAFEAKLSLLHKYLY